MRRIFSGEFRHAMDEKNRVTIPAVWRRATDGEEFFSVPDQNSGFLVILPPGEFDRVGEQVNTNPSITPADRRIFIRQFYSRAKQCVTDRQGRILLPEDQRAALGLKDEVMLVGGHSRFEIWDPARWEQISKHETPTYQQVANLVGL